MFFFFQAEDGIRDLVRSRGLGDVYKRQAWTSAQAVTDVKAERLKPRVTVPISETLVVDPVLSLIHI